MEFHEGMQSRIFFFMFRNKRWNIVFFLLFDFRFDIKFDHILNKNLFKLLKGIVFV